MRYAIAGSVVQPDQIIENGIVVIEDRHILWAGSAAQCPPQILENTTRIEHPTGYLLPGLVDIHNHGAAGVSFPNLDTTKQARAAIAEHLRYGTTRMLASTVSATQPDLIHAIEMLLPLARSGELAGIHAEGPYLSVQRCGAQDPRVLRAPHAAEISELFTAADGHLRTMTIAPELPGAQAAFEQLVSSGVVPSLGHTDATLPQMREGLAAVSELMPRGQRATITHLFNGMAPMHHRTPGPVPAALAWAKSGRGVVEIIGDGVHLAAELIAEVFEIVGAGNVALVTDSMAATGLADGSYQLGPQMVNVAAGVARLPAEPGHEGNLAGGTSHLIDQIRLCVQVGVPVVDAVRAASAVPAGVLPQREGEQFGQLREGFLADLVAVDAHWQVQQVWRAGEQLNATAQLMGEDA